MKKPPFPAVLIRVRADSVSLIACTVTELFPATESAHVDTAGAKNVLARFDELATTKAGAWTKAAAAVEGIVERHFPSAAAGIPADSQSLAQPSEGK